MHDAPHGALQPLYWQLKCSHPVARHTTTNTVHVLEIS